MKRRGFTLVELIIALALTALLFGTITFAFGQALRAWKITADRAARHQVANISLERLARDIRSASSISAATSPGGIRLTVEGETIEYSWDNLKLKRKKGNYSAYLTNEGEIGNVSFSFPAQPLVQVKVDNYTVLAGARDR